MAFSKTLFLVALAFAVLLISAEVEAHRDLAETTTTTQQANTDRYNTGYRNNGGHGNYGGGYGGGHGGHGGHGAEAVETETEN